MQTDQAPLFANRFAAGEFLADKLSRETPHQLDLVLALPRGGVPVAFPVAEKLCALLDIFIVRKLGVPGYEELAMGAIATGGVQVLNQELVQHLSISEKMIRAVAQEELAELQRREALYRDGREPPDIAGKHAVLVDDGLATGASMRVAVPVASSETCEQFRHEVDEIVCGMTPEPFMAVGCWYEDFTQTSDDEVRDLLNRAAHLHRAEEVKRNHHLQPIT